MSKIDQEQTFLTKTGILFFNVLIISRIEKQVFQSGLAHFTFGMMEDFFYQKQAKKKVNKKVFHPTLSDSPVQFDTKFKLLLDKDVLDHMVISTSTIYQIKVYS